MKAIVKAILPQNKRIGFCAMISAVLFTAISALIRMYFLYQRTPFYEELVTGYTSWIAYYKEGDMTLAYHVIFGLTGFYLLCSFVFNLLSLKIPFLQKSKEEMKINHRQREMLSTVTTLFYLLVFTQFSLSAVLRIGSILVPSIYMPFSQGFYLIQILAAAGICVFWFVCRKNGQDKWISKSIFLSQLFLPLVFLLIVYYEYEYEGKVITQYWSPVFFIVELCLFLCMIFYVIYKKKTSPKTTIYVTSFLALAVFASYQLPKGTISERPLEFYHYGELSVPLHQFLEFGTIPYLDTMPIHGVCDYFQAAVWYGLFDGTYASFEAAMVIGCVIIAVITAAVCYYCVESKVFGMLCVLLFSLFGDQYYYVRWAFALPSILIVFSKKSREDFSKMLWYWVFISILSIAWNPSIGGTCALAMLPMILWEGFYEKGYLQFVRIWKERKNQKRWIAAYIFLFIFGFCFIPMFIAILRYIIENSAAILETTGDILKEELRNPFVWYATFGFGIPLVLSYYFTIGKEKEEKKLAVYAALFLFIFNALIVKYTFVRTQFGERGIIAATIGCLFLILMIFVPILKKTWNRETFALLLFLFLVTAGTKGANVLELPKKMMEREVISQEYVYIDGEEIGIPSLGPIYMKDELRKELISLNHIANELCGDEYQFVDMTNQLAHYNILDKKVLLPFSSTYNTNNEVMQTKAIEVLNELHPEVIVVSPEWKHDSGSLSTRNYHLYQWIMQHDYVPCKYESILFFTNNDEISKKYEAAYEEMGNCMHVEYLKKLPTVWAGEAIENQYTEDIPMTMQLIDSNSTMIGDQTYQLEASDNYFFFFLDEAISGKKADFLRIRADIAENTEKKKYEGVLYFMEEGESVKEAHRFIYSGGAEEILIPLSTSPYWSYAEKNQAIMLNLIGEQLTGCKVELELQFESYTGIGKEQ